MFLLVLMDSGKRSKMIMKKIYKNKDYEDFMDIKCAIS